MDVVRIRQGAEKQLLIPSFRPSAELSGTASVNLEFSKPLPFHTACPFLPGILSGAFFVPTSISKRGDYEA